MSMKRLYLVCAVLILSVGLTPAFADHDHDKDGDNDHGHGNGHAYGREKHDRDRDRQGDDHHDFERHEDRRYYQDHDRDLHDWYRAHYNNLPPGLAKRDRLPPGLERQLIVRGTLPPGLRREMRPCPVEVVRYLPPPPVGYMHTVIGGHIVLVNRSTFFVLDVFHFEL
jgi:Ni/Co efflux regulator RcnB